jgi:MoaA/NifB/PqqE/SkfB family radical SAM enzyme
MIERIRAASPEISIDLTSNGTLLTEDMCQKILSQGLRRIIISLDGASAETAESIRLGIKFARLLVQLEKLAALRNSMGSKTLLRLNCMVGFGVYPQLEDFVAMAGRLGFDEIRFLELQAASPEEAEQNFLSGVRSDGGLQVRRAERLSGQLGIRLFWPVIRAQGCEHPYEPHLSEDGEVFPCCFYAHGRKLYQGGRVLELESLSFGNVGDTPIEQIWDSRAYREFRQSVAEGNFGEGCRACFLARKETSQEFRDRFGFA